jgi:L-asparagine transporter-like permease
MSCHVGSKVDISSMRGQRNQITYLLTWDRFLALGGAIGTGLFVGSGAILSLVGPAPLFMAYLSMMLVVWIVMNNLAGKASSTA